MLRKISLLLAAAAFFAPPLWAYIETSQFTETVQQERGLVCGMPILAIYILAVFSSGLLSAGAIATGIPAYVRLAKPRPKLRLLELVVIGLPLLLFGSLALWLYLTGA